ncbi:hypothetical protein GA0115240_17223 [Streptomyces sp. DvalAA-14]|uniref:hypothetical protein n=1 Tax=unclassified Streptomyces TaxID=2593676 RepID=UPI00081AF435|nr:MULTISPECIES: hypothetical protein [unclassified Streptomyces]MYS24987.1 hypothetical protein [Streptomyces sp. SID4948]SCE51137.1 hypothetical protein GA0115240_17223 [Streptomyces sp. DvalAA-14]
MASKRLSPLTYAAVVAAAPVLLLAGDPLARAALRRARATATPHPGGGFVTVHSGPRGPLDAHAFFVNPLAIALAAPSRWVGDRLRR